MRLRVWRGRTHKPTYVVTVEVFVPGLSRDELADLYWALNHAYDGWASNHFDSRWSEINTSAAISSYDPQRDGKKS